MKKTALLLAMTLTSVTVGCASDDVANTSITLKDCAIQTTIPGAKATGAFLTVTKDNADALSLIGAKADSVTDHVEIHEMVMADGKMMMKKMDSYPLEKGDNIFKKGSYHIMLMSLQKALPVGDKHALTLMFSDGSSATCQAQVKSVEELTPKGMQKMQHNHGNHSHSH